MTGQQAVKAQAAAAKGAAATAAAAAAAAAKPAGKALTGPAADLVEGMLYTLQPPEKASISAKLRPPMDAFVRHIMLGQ